jgi:uncharacterized damage-inducible protein DinB
METLSFLRRLFEYDHWGNREALGSLSTVSVSVERPLKTFSHIIGAQRIWLARLGSSDLPSAGSWPTLTLDECCAATEEMHQRWTAFLGRLTPEKLGEDLVYRSSKGVEFKRVIQDVLMHLVTHSAYHRGQLAVVVRETGVKPA